MDYYDDEDMDELQDNQPTPDTSVASRPPIGNMLPGSAPLSKSPIAGNPAPTMPTGSNPVAQAIAARSQLLNNPMLTDAFKSDRDKINGLEKNKIQSDYIGNLTQAAQTAARGAAAPVQSNLGANISNEAEDQLKAGLNEQNKRDQIVNSIIRRMPVGSVGGLVGQNVTKPIDQKQAGRQQLLDQRIHNQVLNGLRNNKQLGQRLVQFQNLDNATSNFANAEHTTPQQVDELQQAIRSNLGIKSGSGVNEREHTYINTLGLNADRMAQFLTGNPVDIAKDDALVGHLKDLVKLEQGNIKNQYGKAITAATSGHESMYKRSPDLANDLKNAVNSYSNQMQSTLDNSSGGNDSSPVRIQDPNGVTRLVPANLVDVALQKGGKRL